MAEQENPEFISQLQSRIQAAGGISFAEFMELALYHPVHGYYSAACPRIGKQGDFFTSSSIHSCFGRLLAKQLEQMWQLLGKGRFTVAEQGAGEGYLALDILDAIAEDYPDFYSLLNYRIVEISPALQKKQAEQLVRHIDAGRVEWCALPQLKGMQGCFLSNELVDAFPVHLIEKHSGTLQEVFVVNQGAGFAEELRPLSTERISNYFTALGLEPAEGNRCEVNLAARQWMVEVAEVVKKGFVLTIDYGFPAEELFAAWRRTGTLLCYQQHQTNEDPYRQPGRQDITAHVDFTTLQEAGRKRGLVPLYFGHQYQFLMGLGFLEMLIELQSRETDPQKAQALRMNLKTLILPDGGMGDSFKVLVQGKHVGTPELLCSRKIQNISIASGV